MTRRPVGAETTLGGRAAAASRAIAAGSSAIPGPRAILRDGSAELPWMLPAGAVALVAAVLAGNQIARVLRARRAIATFLVLCLGAIASATLTPLGAASALAPSLPAACDFSRLELAPLAQLRGVNDTSLNIALFVPLGIAVALLPRSWRTLAVVVGAISLPVAIELVQLVVRPLGRGCESADVIDNLTGLAVGLTAGILVRVLGTFVASRSAGSARRAPRAEAPLRDDG